MGEFLAVIRPFIPAFGTLLLLLSACAQAGGGLGAVAMSTVAGVKPATATSQAPLDARQLSVTMPARAIKFPIVPIEKDGDVTVWAAQDGSQVALRGGMVISSRGFGMDLMSAEVPTVATLLSGATHPRVYHYIDGANQPIRQSYACSTRPGTTTDGPAVAHQIEETCVGTAGTVVNEFWISKGGTVETSRQWLSQDAGHLILQPVDG